MKKRNVIILFTLFCMVLFLFPHPSSAQQGKVVHETFHAASLEGNPLGDLPERDVVVYLPPHYERETDKRYPVVYMLHGWVANISGLKENCFMAHDISSAMDSWLKEGGIKEMILVLPDSFNRVGGSWYTNSRATGEWANYVARDLVEYIDDTYRTITNRESRAIMGHSMGGYGALKIGIIDHDVFSCIGMLSAPVDFGETAVQENDLMYARVSKLKSWEDFEKLDWNTQMYLAQCAAFVPNQKKPPFYCDFPFREGRIKDKKAMKKFIKHDGFRLLEEHIDSLEEASAIYIECGTNDANLNQARRLHRMLQDYGIEHRYEENRGSHFSGIVSGSRNALELFSSTLQFK